LRETTNAQMDFVVSQEIKTIGANIPHPIVSGETFLFASPREFSRRMQEMQSFYQQWLLKRIEGQALKAKTVAMLQNLESARDVCQDILNAEPQLSLPVLGENVTGTWAFRVAPVFFLFLCRYLVVMIRTARLFEREMKNRWGSGAAAEQKSKERNARLFPHTANALRAMPADVQNDRLGRLNFALLVLFLALPATSAIPIATVQWMLHGPIWWMFLVIAPFAFVFADTGQIVRLYVKR